MNKKLLSRLAPGLFAVVLFTACRPAATVKGNLDVIPQPQEIVLARDTTPFIIDRSTTIVYPTTNEKMHRTADCPGRDPERFRHPELQEADL